VSARPDDAGRRGQLVRESARLFREKGYEATSVRDIAAATGLQSGSWVYHFKTKQDILAAVMEEGLQQALERIEAIAKTIGEVDTIAGSIASSVEEQGSATQEIARNVHQASLGTADVAKNITGVREAAEHSNASAGEVLTAARDLSRQSEALQHEMEKFLQKVRAA